MSQAPLRRGASEQLPRKEVPLPGVRRARTEYSSNNEVFRGSNFAEAYKRGVKIHPPVTRTESVKYSTAVEVHHEEEHHEEDAHFFVPSTGLTTKDAEELLKQWGRNELEEKIVPKWLIVLRLLTAPMPIMIWLAALVEATIQNWPDMGILLGIQFLNCSIAYYEVTKAGDAVAALKASLKPMATVKRDGKFQTLHAALLVPGDLVLLASGAAIPADCLINEGQIDVDQSALTGESLPVTLYKGDSAKMGSTVTRGEVHATVDCTGKNTFFGKTASLLQEDGGMGNLQKLLMTIMMVLVVLSFTLCGIALAYLIKEGEPFRDALSFMVVLLVASIPIAIEIVVTTTLATGSRFLSKKGAIVTRLAAIEDMAGMTILCSDKTGTLTLNKMVIQEETPLYVDGENQYKLLLYAAMAAKYTEPARDALDTLVLSKADLSQLKDIKQIDYMPFDPTVKRTEGTIQLPDGTIFKTTKGAPQIILKLIHDEKVKKQVEADVQRLGVRGIRSLAVAKTNQNGEWYMVGLLTFLDPPRPDTRYTIEKANTFGVEVKMITGDHLLIAKETARVLGMGTIIHDSSNLPKLDESGHPPKDLHRTHGDTVLNANGFAQVFPEHKFLIVETLRQLGHKVGMTGDGVNDAPALKRADVGVAVEGATDAARAAADIVLTQPGLSTIVDGLIISREIFQRMKNFLTYRIAATLQLLVFFFIAVLALHPESYMPEQLPPTWTDPDWPRFFHMPVLMLMLITLLNDGALLSIGYDHVKPSAQPDKWNLPALFFVSGVLAFVALLSSLLLLWAALDSWNPHGLFGMFGLSGLTYGQITTMVYLKVAVSDFLTLFSSRTDDWFWTVRPSPLLMIAFIVATTTSTVLACSWPLSYPDKIETIGLLRHVPRTLAVWVWGYCLLFWFIQDAAKVFTCAAMHKFNLFNVNAHVGKMTEAELRHVLIEHANKGEKQALLAQEGTQYGTH